MSLPHTSMRALSRPRSTQPRTLLPFLYQTPTLQAWHSQRRNMASRDRYDDVDHIPFENVGSTPPPRNTTLTGSERAIFQKLQRKVASETPAPAPGNTDYNSAEVQDIEKEDKDFPDTDDSAASLDSVFDAVLSGRAPVALSRGASGFVNRRSNVFGQTENMRSIAEAMLKESASAAKKEGRKNAAERAARMKEVRERERERINTLILEAKSDVEVWDVLKREVFDVIAGLNLEGRGRAGEKEVEKRERRKAKKEKEKKKKDDAAEKKDDGVVAAEKGLDASASIPTSQETNNENQPENTVSPPQEQSTTKEPQPPKPHPGILFPNFPHHIMLAIRHLRQKHPTSQLPLSILPTLKSLGRAAYMLCATTPLYNLLLRTAWIQYGSYSLLNTLLTDMDNAGIEFDNVTLQILDEVVGESERARGGVYGYLVREVWGMERFVEETRKLDGWREGVVRRLGRTAVERLREGRLVRRMDGREGEGEGERIVLKGFVGGFEGEEGIKDPETKVEKEGRDTGLKEQRA